MDATTFPISFTYHLIFCIIACAFFVLQFIRLRRPHQLVLAAAIAGSLVIYLAPENQTLFHTVGLFELILLLGAIVLSFLTRNRQKTGEETPASDSAQGDQAQ